ncbi:MAG TPA: hypothetical protein VMY05_00755 [Acidobacteriota bacterium]|nr:hypothetical protein [Acidobacteriota bacterium]
MRGIKLMLLALAALALVWAGCDREITGDVQLADTGSTGCFSCHSDKDVVLKVAQEQYKHSQHATGENTNRNRLYSSSYGSCEKCHTHQGFVAEVTGEDASGDYFTRIDCFTCHQPHSSGAFGLRLEAAATLADKVTTYDRGSSNLCAACHQGRRDAATYVVDSVMLTSRWSPHYSVQSDMLLGVNAYEYDGYAYRNSWHSTGVTEGCVECHMRTASVHASVGGHSWNVANHERHIENLTGCNRDGCHVDPPLDSLNRLAFADYDGDTEIETVRDEITGLLDSLKFLLLDAGLVDTTDEGEVEPKDSLIVPDADSAGAVYNYLFVLDDGSMGVHNTNYVLDLLQSAINYIATGDPSGLPANRRSSFATSR